MIYFQINVIWLLFWSNYQPGLVILLPLLTAVVHGGPEYPSITDITNPLTVAMGLEPVPADMGEKWDTPVTSVSLTYGDNHSHSR